MYYVLGLLFADGNISRDGTVTIVQKTHPEVIYTIAGHLGRFVSVSKIGACTVGLGGRNLAEWLLANFGVGPCKSDALQWPTIPARFMHDFIRGFFDGDGSIWFGRMGNGSAGYRRADGTGTLGQTGSGTSGSIFISAEVNTSSTSRIARARITAGPFLCFSSRIYKDGLLLQTSVE